MGLAVDGTNLTSVIISGTVNSGSVRNFRTLGEENIEISETNAENRTRTIKGNKINTIVLGKKGRERILVVPLVDTQPREDLVWVNDNQEEVISDKDIIVPKKVDNIDYIALKIPNDMQIKRVSIS